MLEVWLSGRICKDLGSVPHYKENNNNNNNNNKETQILY
jgi:hypothetical protein